VKSDGDAWTAPLVVDEPIVRLIIDLGPWCGADRPQGDRGVSLML